jgi:hypothetical protein
LRHHQLPMDQRLVLQVLVLQVLAPAPVAQAG